MIRLVSLGSQVNDGAREFAFVDTVTMRFLDVGGVQVFEDRADLEAAMQAAETAPALRARLIDLLPAEAPVGAQGIPLVAGMLWLWQQDDEKPWPQRVNEDGNGPPGCRPIAPDLTDPDTRAAYVPRLAIARGASPDDVRLGWRVRLPRAWGGEWEAGALFAGDWGCSLHVPDGAPTDLDGDALLALVLAHAWPEEKRVPRA